MVNTPAFTPANTKTTFSKQKKTLLLPDIVGNFINKVNHYVSYSTFI